MVLDFVDVKERRDTRYLILLIIFIVTAVNYADRATTSVHCWYRSGKKSCVKD